MRNNYHHSSELIAVYCFIATILIVLSGCQVSPPEAKEGTLIEPGLSPVPALPIAGANHYRINSAQSEIRILVFRGGPLAKFGHNHVMLARQITGDVYQATTLHSSAFILRFPVKQIEIDPAKARAEEGKDFDTRPSPEAIAGTRKNMLGPDVLDAENYPDITIRSVDFEGTDRKSLAKIQITLHGVTKELTTPVSLDYDGDELMANGTMILRTSDFDIKPFSVLGGGLLVQDEIKIRFYILAEKA